MSAGWVPQVWAPDAAQVELVLVPEGATAFAETDRRLPMVRDDEVGLGWWVAPGAAAAGTRYGFAVDGGPARPDPRSERQPAGVHGPSEVFDPGAHSWADTAWRGRPVLGAVTYELHVGTFTAGGTLDSAIERLDHLRDLGVDIVELMPLAAFDGDRGWGYDGVHLWAVHEAYGGPPALQRFVDAAHAAGLGVALDVVYNHLGPSGNYTGTFGPYFSSAHETPWGSGINLDSEGSIEVRRWIVENALRWFRDFHLDALRLDAVHALRDDSPVHVLAELSDAVQVLADELGRPLGLVAESDLNDPTTVTPVAEGGQGMTAQWADDVHHAVHCLVTGERHGYYADFAEPSALATALTGVFVHDGSWSSFRGSPWGHPVPDGIDGHRFVVCSANHDQIGNRARGDRPGPRGGTDPRELGGQAIAAALVLTSAMSPMLFMGEEWGASTPWQFFTDFTDPELGRAVSEGRLAEFAGHAWDTGGDAEGQGAVPDPQDPATFAASTLDWEEVVAPGHADLLAWHRTLIRLRRTEPDLASGDRSAVRVEILDAGPATEPGELQDSARAGTVLRVTRGRVSVAVNTGHRPQTLAVAAGASLLTAWAEVGLDAGRLTLGPGSVAILRD